MASLIKATENSEYYFRVAARGYLCDHVNITARVEVKHYGRRNNRLMSYVFVIYSAFYFAFLYVTLCVYDRKTALMYIDN